MKVEYLEQLKNDLTKIEDLMSCLSLLREVLGQEVDQQESFICTVTGEPREPEEVKTHGVSPEKAERILKIVSNLTNNYINHQVIKEPAYSHIAQLVDIFNCAEAEEVCNESIS